MRKAIYLFLTCSNYFWYLYIMISAAKTVSPTNIHVLNVGIRFNYKMQTLASIAVMFFLHWSICYDPVHDNIEQNKNIGVTELLHILGAFANLRTKLTRQSPRCKEVLSLRGQTAEDLQKYLILKFEVKHTSEFIFFGLHHCIWYHSSCWRIRSVHCNRLLPNL